MTWAESAIQSFSDPAVEHLEVPPGEHVFPYALTSINKSFALIGSGMQTSKLVFQKDTEGLQFFNNSPFQQVEVRNLTIENRYHQAQNTIHNPKIGIDMRWTKGKGTGLEHRYALIENVRVIGQRVIQDDVTVRDNGWDIGIHLNNALGAVVRNFTIIQGADSGRHGISLTGNSVDASLSGGFVLGFDTGITSLEGTEGVHISDTKVLGCRSGIYLSSDVPDSAQPLPLSWIDRCHLNTDRYGIIIDRRGQAFVTNNSLYHLSDHYYSGVTFGAMTDLCRMIGNQVFSGGGAASNGCVNSGKMNVIKDNYWGNLSTGLWIAPGSQATVFGNNLGNSTDHMMIDSTKGEA